MTSIIPDSILLLTQRQTVNDIWHRVVTGLQLFEMCIGKEKATLDPSSLDRIFLGMPASEMRAEAEQRLQAMTLEQCQRYVGTQIRAFARGIEDISEQASRDLDPLVRDLLEWLAGRKAPEWDIVDDHAIVALMAVLDYDYPEINDKLRQLRKPGQAGTASQPDMNAITFVMGAAGELDDRRAAMKDLDLVFHKRGAADLGMARLDAAVLISRATTDLIDECRQALSRIGQ